MDPANPAIKVVSSLWPFWRVTPEWKWKRTFRGGFRMSSGRPRYRTSPLALALACSTILMGCGDDGSSPAATLQSVAIVTDAPTLTFLGATSKLTATPTLSSGAAAAGASISWSSSSPQTASIDANGLVTALADGSTTITATASLDGATATGSITISINIKNRQVQVETISCAKSAVNP